MVLLGLQLTVLSRSLKAAPIMGSYLPATFVDANLLLQKVIAVKVAQVEAKLKALSLRFHYHKVNSL